MSRSMVKLIHADGFFPPGDAEKYCDVISQLHFVEKPYGLELDNFNLVMPGIEPILSRVLGERVSVDSKRSGIFRKPLNSTIHFEEFDSLNEWCFIIALEKTTLNLYHHISDRGIGGFGIVDAHSALEGWQFNYKNMFEWDIHTNVLLEPNQGVFIRPWVFHSLQDGLVQYYRLITDTKFRVLVMGLPNSNRKQIAKNLQAAMPNSRLFDSIEIRKNLKDIDYSRDGRMRHTSRMLTECRSTTEDCAILDMVCPLPEQRELLNPDIIVWADAPRDECQIEEVANSFVAPLQYDIKCETGSPQEIQMIIERIQTKRF